MHRRIYLLPKSLILFWLLTPGLFAQKFEVLFNGTTLDGWKGKPELWSVQEGAIVGETQETAPIPGNTFLVWQGGEIADFEFRCKVRFQGNNSGVQYRSSYLDEAALALKGYQADLHPNPDYFGMLYSEKTGRGILATRGEQATLGPEEKSIEGKLDTSAQLVDNEWNNLRIIAVGNRLIHQVNGITTIDVQDQHPQALAKGLLGLQLHRGPAMKVEFRNLLLRKLNAKEGTALLAEVDRESKQTTKDAARAESNREQPQEAWLLQEPTPNWIWNASPQGEDRLWMRKSFQVADKPIQSARLYTSCDNRLQLFLNGESLGRVSDWGRPLEKDVAGNLKAGTQVFAADCQNQGGQAGFLLKLQITYEDGTQQAVASDSSWRITSEAQNGWNSPQFDDANWKQAVAHFSLGQGPWGIPNYTTRRSTSPEERLRALEARHIMTPPGFVVERIYSVPPEQGSWVALTTDPQGRIYASDQGNAGLFRVSISQKGETKVEKVSQGDLASVSSAQGLLWAFDSLWLHRNGGNLLRLTDSDGDGQLDTSETIDSARGGGEHGNHAVILSEDKQHIYMCSGNHTPLHDVTASRVPTWNEDLLLPRMWDARGHARGLLAPGGWITQLDPESLTQTLHAIGFRNEYDLTLNRFGDMFTYDADMEWDLGLPWYRPTRICHAVSGAEFGWRSGSGKWPAYYEDSLPPVVDIGPGSPTGILSGREAKFPTRYRDALFALDWTFGTIYAIHLEADGASYTGRAEHFVYSSPLPVTDAIIKDGDLYFAVGGRGTQSALFRVRYVGHEATEAPVAVSQQAQSAREKRRALEAFHGKVDETALSVAWPELSSEDRFIRFAARIAIESQPVDNWATKAYSEADARRRIVANIALSRSGTSSHRKQALASLLALQASQLSDGDMLRLLRAYALNFIRLGRPTEQERQEVISQLDPLLPAEHPDVNTELIRVLTYLRAPSVIDKGMHLIRNARPAKLPNWSELASRNAGYGGTVIQMLENHPPTREIGYAFLLRNMRTGWTLAQRRDYFEFLNQAAKASGGASYPGYLQRIRDEALQNCTNEEREALADVTGEDFNPSPDFEITPPQGPGKAWTTDEALAATRAKPDFENGRSLFFSAKCANCHRVRGLGGNIGPDLTSVPNKFDRRYVVEAIVDPSKDISDQYGSSIVLLEDGRILTGLVVTDEESLTVYPIEAEAKEIRVSRDEVEAIRNSPLSQMPTELLNTLNAQEIADLVGYIMAGGDPSRMRN